MHSDEVVVRLRETLGRVGVDEESPTAADVRRTWAVVKELAVEKVEDIDGSDPLTDGLLAQYGTYDWGEGEHFELNITRQFSFNDEKGEYDHMSQLACTFRFQVTDALRALGEDSLWSFDLELDDFFAKALALPGFTIDEKPEGMLIDYGEV